MAPVIQCLPAAIGFCGRTAWLLLALIGTAAVAGEAQQLLTVASAQSAPAKDTAAKPPWGRIVMVGASVTAGFTASEPLGGPNTPQYCLSRYVDAAVAVPHESTRNLAHAMFFIQPDAEGRRQIDQAIQAGPTLVIGLDFLFWFCYGQGRTENERLQHFEKGLELLEAVRCPLVVGDIPDASAAANRVLNASEIPSIQTRSAANRRLKEWAAKRPKVVILPLSGFMRAVTADQALTIHGLTLPAGKTHVLLQDDQLHPSPPGCAVLALAILDAFQSTRPGPSSGEVRWNPKEVFRVAITPAQEPSGESATRLLKQ